MKEFHSFARFAEHLSSVIEMTALAQHEGLETAAQLVEKQAKKQLGSYQDQAGPFAGWAELADSTKADRERQGYTENDPGLLSGDMQNSIECTVGLFEAAIGSNDEKLVWFELGTSKQPARSDLGIAAVETSDKVVEIIGGNVHAALAGEQVHNGRMEII